MQTPRWITAAAATLLASGWLTATHAETPTGTCKRIGTTDNLAPITEALVPAVNQAFGTQLPIPEAIATTVFRCADRRVMVCTTGANLPCGKANTRRTPNTGMAQWCHDNSNAEFIPAVATGHDTIYAWRCHGGTPRIVRQTLHVDPRGFVAEYWQPLP
jgi:hypothetical protein